MKEYDGYVTGHTYYAYDDGKQGCEFKVKITDMQFLTEMDSVVQDVIKTEVANQNFLYAPNPVLVIIGENIEDGETHYFIPTKDKEWFSIGYYASLLGEEVKDNG